MNLLDIEPLSTVSMNRVTCIRSACEAGHIVKTFEVSVTVVSLRGAVIAYD